MANQGGRRVREQWTTRLGVILAVAGSAVGLGNFLRFPVQAAENGGGAFMIPYFIAFFLLGIPLCWIEWAMGRYGGQLGHGSAPGIFSVIWKSPVAKYVGSLGVIGPLVIFFWYVYAESWTLGYAVYGIFGKYMGLSTQAELQSFLHGYQNIGEGTTLLPAYVFFLITFAANFIIIYFGVSRGIERVSKVAMPILAILGLILAVRVLTLGTPDAAQPDWNVSNGLGFMWNPNLEKLADVNVWLAAAGQIFFTMSVGMGIILTYASYLRKKDDVVLSGLSASSANGFMEVIIGGSVVITAACVFFGSSATVEVAKGGPVNLGFVTMPLIFTRMLGGQFFALLWFMLLFMAGITSSISMLQPAISFMEDDLRISRHVSVGLLALLCFAMCHFAILGIERHLMDDLDFWGGTFLIVLIGLIEIVIFGWVFGMKRGWKELHTGADIRIPSIYWFIIKFVTPVFIAVLLGVWFYQESLKVIKMENYPPEDRPYVLILRLVLLALFGGFCYLIHYAWKKHHVRRETT
jgi:NSS family neurotransmitter:Na+ symporter